MIKLARTLCAPANHERMRHFYLIRIKGWRSSSTAIFDSRLDPHEEVNVTEVFGIAEVNVVLDVNAGSER